MDRKRLLLPASIAVAVYALVIFLGYSSSHPELLPASQFAYFIFHSFLAKFIFASSFIVPLLLFSLSTAVIAAIVWGFSLLGGFSYLLARTEKVRAWPVISEHLLIAGAVIAATHSLGHLIQKLP